MIFVLLLLYRMQARTEDFLRGGANLAEVELGLQGRATKGG